MSGEIVATSVPSLMRMTVGVSASLTNQRSFDAMVFASDHVPDRSSENFKVADASCRSSQLRSTPRPEDVSWACPDSPWTGTALA